MASSTYDQSIEDGELVELYKFFIGSQVWRYTSLDKDYFYAGDNYVSLPMTRSDIVKSTNLNKQTTTINVPKDIPVAEMFRVFPPGDIVGCSILQGHAADPDQEFLGIFSGKVIGGKRVRSHIELICEPSSTTLKKTGLRRRYQVSCPYVLFDSGCKVDRSSVVEALTVTAISGASVTLQGAGSLGDGHFNGGYAAWSVNTDYPDFRTIESHVGDVVTFMFPPHTLSIGQVISVYPGCNFTTNDCLTKFSNLDNYGGFPFHPNKEPFSGESVF